MRVLAAVLLSVLVLSSCSYFDQDKPRHKKYVLRYDTYPSLSMDVKEVEVINHYVMPMREPNVEHLFPTPIYQSLDRLFKTKLLPLGDSGILRVTVQEASVTSQPIPVDVGFLGALKKEPVEKLTAKVVVRLQLVDESAPDVEEIYAEVVSNRTKTLHEDMSPTEVDKAYFQLTKEIVDDVNQGMRATIQKYFRGRSYATTPG